MATQLKLAAESRTTSGKGAARSLRQQGMVPAVIYGHGREPESLTLEAAALGKLLLTATAASVLEVTVGSGAPVQALIREVQRNPVRQSEIVHLDLYEIHADETITVSVPVHLVGTADGVRNFGGVLDHVLREVEIECLPRDLPEHIELDVTALGIGDSIHVRDISVPGAEVLQDGDLTVATVVAPRAEEAPAPVVEAVASDEPELIRKAKADEEETEEEA
ncbi:MAG TPA: 50S ribosomal protein L25 [Gemmatimonadales bacterium]|nr:50S ribosomal protein L25 [Gemmatimonadales bacterium]